MNSSQETIYGRNDIWKYMVETIYGRVGKLRRLFDVRISIWVFQ